MLVIQRLAGERFMIFPNGSGGDVITVTVVQSGNRVRLGIEAPSEIRVYREELLAREGMPTVKSAVPVAPEAKS
jgi:carbon storage regulator CsrA